MTKVVYRVGIVVEDGSVSFLSGFTDKCHALFTQDSTPPLSFESEEQAAAMSLAMCQWNGFSYDIVIFSEEDDCDGND